MKNIDFFSNYISNECFPFDILLLYTTKSMLYPYVLIMNCYFLSCCHSFFVTDHQASGARMVTFPWTGSHSLYWIPVDRKWVHRSSENPLKSMEDLWDEFKSICIWITADWMSTKNYEQIWINLKNMMYVLHFSYIPSILQNFSYSENLFISNISYVFINSSAFCWVHEGINSFLAIPALMHPDFNWLMMKTGHSLAWILKLVVQHFTLQVKI